MQQPPTQPLTENAGDMLILDETIQHLQAAARNLDSISDFMAYLTRTIIDELEVRKGQRGTEQPMKRQTKQKSAPVQSTPEERDLAEIIHVLKVNIDAPQVLLNPDTCFTKGQLAFLVEILEQHQKTTAKE